MLFCLQINVSFFCSLLPPLSVDAERLRAQNSFFHKVSDKLTQKLWYGDPPDAQAIGCRPRQDATSALSTSLYVGRRMLQQRKSTKRQIQQHVRELRRLCQWATVAVDLGQAGQGMLVVNEQIDGLDEKLCRQREEAIDRCARATSHEHVEAKRPQSRSGSGLVKRYPRPRYRLLCPLSLKLYRGSREWKKYRGD